MPKLTNKAIRRTDPNYRKSSLLKTRMTTSLKAKALNSEGLTNETLQSVRTLTKKANRYGRTNISQVEKSFAFKYYNKCHFVVDRYLSQNQALCCF